MADVTFRINTESTKALNDFSKLTLSQQKMDLETKKLNNSLQRQSQLIEKNGKNVAKGGSSGPSLTSYVPGGGGAEQFKQTLGALGITGLAGAVISLKNAIDANTQAVLDRAKEQRELSRKIGPTDYFQGKDPRFQGEYQANRNKIAQTTATPLEEIDKLNSSFSAIVTSAEDLNNVISSIAIASKLNLGSMEELIALEQKNIADGGAAGNAVADLTKLNYNTNGAAQVKTILDEIALFKNQNMGFALGTSLIKNDAVNAEDNMKLLAAFQEKGSNENLRSYMRVDENVEGDEMFDKFFKFITAKSEKLGMSKEVVIDNIVKQGDLDSDTGDALKAVIKDVNGLNEYLVDFSASTSTSQKSLESMIKTLDELRKSNISFDQSFKEDQVKVDAEIKNASTGPTVESEAFNKQMALNQKAIEKGMDTVLSKDTNGMVKDNWWNRTMLADEKIPFVTNAANYQKELKKENSEISDRFDKGTNSKWDYVQYGWNTMQQYNPMSGGFGSAERAQEQFDKSPFLKDLLSVGANDIPIVGGAVTYGQTGKLLPGKYDTKDEQGNMIKEFSLGGLGQAGLDLASMGVGGFFGKRAGNKATLEAIKELRKQKKVLRATNEVVGAVKPEKYERSITSAFDDFLNPKEVLPGTYSQIDNLGYDDAVKISEKLKKVNEKSTIYTNSLRTSVPYTSKIPFTDGGLTAHQLQGMSKGTMNGAIGSHIVNEAFPAFSPIPSDTESMVKSSYDTGSRDKIEIYSPKEDLVSVDNGIKELGSKLDALIQINKDINKIQTDSLDTQKKIKDNTFNATQKPFMRNSIK